MNISRRGTTDGAGPAQRAVPIEIVKEQPSHRAQTPIAPENPASESESSPRRPVKKAKASAVESSDEDSGESKKNVTQARVGTAKTRGTRQPIKRGAKRF